jgi:hypothetical protein
LHKKLHNMWWYEKCAQRFHNKHYWGLSDRIDQLYEDMQQKKRKHKITESLRKQSKNISVSSYFYSENSIIYALNTSNNQNTIADQLDTIAQSICNNADTQNITLDTDLESCLDIAIGAIRNTDNPHQLVFNTALVNHVTCEIEDRINAKDQINTPKKRNTHLFIRALEQFVMRLNPITQIKDTCKCLVNIAYFVADITLGKLYLTQEQYQLRKNNMWTSAHAPIPLEHLTFSEECIDMIAQCVADCVYCFDIFKIARYVKNIQRLCTANKHASSIAQRLKNAFNIMLAKAPLFVSSEGIVIKSIPNIQKINSSSGEVIHNSHALLSIQQSVLAPLKHEFHELHHLFDNKIKGFGACANKYLKLDLEHIFGIKFDLKKDILNNIKGFHLDMMHKIQQLDIIKFTNMKTGTGGTYSANLIYENSKPIYKTFFPAHWTRKEAISAIYEACHNFVKSGVQPIWGKDGKCRINSITNHGIKMEMYLTQTGRITTAYPIIRKN